MLDDDVVSFDVAEVEEGSPEPFPEGLGGAERLYTDVGDLVPLLRPEVERRDKSGHGAGEKDPTFHHSASLCRWIGITARFVSPFCRCS